MTVINFRAYTDPRDVPTLVLIDLQQEYTASPRALALSGADVALANCKAALGHARKMGFPVAYARWLDQSPFFNPGTRFSRWIEGFEPMGVDLIFERNRPSCYASNDFADIITRGGGNFVFAGFAGESACLSTAVDAFHRGHHVTFLHDASASHALNGISAESIHEVMREIVQLYGVAIDTQTWIEATRHGTSLRGPGLYEGQAGAE